MIKLLSLSILLFLFPGFYGSPANDIFYDSENENVKSIWFEKDTWRLAYPVITMDKGEHITLHFDVLGGEGGVLNYKIIHCDRDWHESDLFSSDYLTGFDENPLHDYRASFNTTVKYVFYSLDLPNDDVDFKISGNYTILIYRPGEEDNPLLVRRFFVSEGTTGTSIIFRKPMTAGKDQTDQQSEITISTGSLAVNNPYTDITLTILQNGRWDRAKYNMLPDFVGNGKLEYNTLSDKTLFPGGNEFRYFDIKTIRQKRQNIRDIVFLNGNYHAYLLPSEDREFRQYFYNEDFNGKFYIAMEESDDPDTEGDYVWVYFTLPSKYPVEGGSVYVEGSFTDWKTGPSNRMKYDPVKGCYEATFLLKQGWYNYEYAFVPDNGQNSGRYYFEGSHYETSNDYVVLTYFRDPRQRYDRLTDAAVFNSLGKK